MIATVTRTIPAIDAARVKAVLTASAIRYAIQVDGNDAVVIVMTDEAQEANQAIDAELSR